VVTFFQAAENLAAFITRAETAGAPAAAREMAQHGRNADRMELMLTAHAPYTESPAPAPASPSMITGTLVAAQEAHEPFPLSATAWEAHAGPTSLASSKNGPYGRFLQFGGTHAAHNPSGRMWWFEEGIWHDATVLNKAERPYLTYALEKIIADGSLHDVAVIAFYEAVGA
jgi:hypothetical protein